MPSKDKLTWLLLFMWLAHLLVFVSTWLYICEFDFYTEIWSDEMYEGYWVAEVVLYAIKLILVMLSMTHFNGTKADTFKNRALILSVSLILMLGTIYALIFVLDKDNYGAENKTVVLYTIRKELFERMLLGVSALGVVITAAKVTIASGTASKMHPFALMTSDSKVTSQFHQVATEQPMNDGESTPFKM